MHRAAGRNNFFDENGKALCLRTKTALSRIEEPGKRGTSVGEFAAHGKESRR